jgi:transposase
MRRDGKAHAQKGGVKPWLKKRWCIPSVGAEFVWRMEEVLDLYEEPHDERRPVVCFDEMPCRLVAEKRSPLPAEPGGRPERYDYEYERRGVANVFAFFEPKGAWRHLEVTERRAARDFASQMRSLVDEHYPKAEKVRVVMDNLNTHTGAALYEAFSPAEARRVLRRLEFHHTPKHASWLNQVEIELSALGKQCLSGRRIPDKETLAREVEAWERERNERGATVEWRFTAEDAREKLARLYPPRS